MSDVQRKYLDDNDPRARRATPRVRSAVSNSRSASLTLLDAMDDPALFAPWFSKNPKTWIAWRVVIAALFALPMTAEQLVLYRQCTGRSEPPHEVARECWLVCGRRAGKSFILALIAVWLACFHSYAEYLAPGERGTVLIIATDRKQARVILRYVRALLTKVPMLARLVERELQEAIDLKNNITIEIATCSWRTTRGVSLVCAMLDEVAYFSSEDSANPDHEVVNALRPAMATIPNAMLLCASSPYARKGVLFEAHRQHYGKDHDPVLVVQAATRDLNPTVPQSFIDAEVERDPANASAEYGAQFRTDVEAFVQRDAIEACVSEGVRERAPIASIKYRAFVDPSGGSGKDSMTLAIGHREDGVVFVDAIRERKPPFAPSAVVKDFASLLSDYGITTIVGDRYAGSWPTEAFKQHGITYEASAAPKSQLFGDALPLINSKQVDLLDNTKMVEQFVGLERRTARSGKDSIDHAPNGHDDVANAVAGLIAQVNSRKHSYDTTMAWIDGDDDRADFDYGNWVRTSLIQSLFGRYDQ